MNNLIQTPGERIKKFRKENKIKQHEICGNDLTRNMLSMIENNKATLTDNIKNLLIKNLKNLCDQKKIQTNLVIESLFESEQSQILSIYDKYIDNIYHNEEKVIELENSDELIQFVTLLNKYNLKEELSIIYKEIGNFHINRNNYSKSYFYYLKALEVIQSTLNYNKDLLIYVINNIMFCCIKLNNYNEVINYAHLAYFYVPKMTIAQSYKVHFNTILAYKNLLNYDAALIEIENLELHFTKYLEDNISKNISLKILLGNIYTCKNEYSKAIETHKKLFPLVKPQIELYIIELLNLIEIYIQIKNRNLSILYLKEVISLIPIYKQTSTTSRICEIYLCIGIAYEFIESFNDSKKYYLEALTLIKETKEYFILEKLFNRIFNLIKIIDDYTFLEDIKVHFLELFSLNLIKDHKLSLNLIQLYMNFREYQNVTDTINFILECSTTK